MRVRDALEADAGTLAGMTRAPTQVMRNVIHDRTVRVAERTDDGEGGAESTGMGDGVDAEPADPEGTADASDPDGAADPERDGDADPSIVGFVGFDAERECVYVTHLGGEAETLARLLDEPVRFARKSGLSVQMIVPESESDLQEAVETFGFEHAGGGPHFEGTPTRRYLLETTRTS